MALSCEDLNKINNNINSDFENISLRQFTSLEINRPYLIFTLSMMNSRYGKCVLATLFDDNDRKFKCFLPKRVVEHLSEENLSKINFTQAKYTLTYIGQSKPLFKDAKCRPLLKFGLLE